MQNRTTISEQPEATRDDMPDAFISSYHSLAKLLSEPPMQAKDNKINNKEIDKIVQEAEAQTSLILEELLKLETPEDEESFLQSMESVSNQYISKVAKLAVDAIEQTVEEQSLAHPRLLCRK